MSSDDGLEPEPLPTPGSNDPTRIRENPLHAADTVAQKLPVSPVPVEAVSVPGGGGVPLVTVLVLLALVAVVVAGGVVAALLFLL